MKTNKDQSTIPTIEFEDSSLPSPKVSSSPSNFFLFFLIALLAFSFFQFGKHSPLRGDMNNDKVLNLVDLSILASKINGTIPEQL